MKSISLNELQVILINSFLTEAKKLSIVECVYVVSYFDREENKDVIELVTIKKDYNEDLTNEEILVQEKELERLVNIGNQSDISFIIDNIDIYCLELMHNREIRAEMSLISGTILYDKTGEMTDNYDQASRLVLAYKNRYEISNVYELISEEAKTKKKEM